MTEMTPEQLAFIKTAKSQAEKRNEIPADLRFPPLSAKFSDDVETESEWLLSYYEYRKSIKQEADIESLVNRYLKEHNKPYGHTISSYRGSLLGLAICDAMGSAVEFMERDSYPAVSDYLGGGPFKLKPGQFTDDTSMAYCLGHSLLRKNIFDPKDQMELYTLWWKKGVFSSTGTCFDIGGTTSTALNNFLNTSEPYSGSTDARSAGNGSLMRLSPVVLFFFKNIKNAIHYAGESSKTTHGARECIDACYYYAALIHGAISGLTKNELLNGTFSPYEGCWDDYELTESIKSIAEGTYKTKKRSEISSSGYVVHTLEAALWSFFNSDSFLEGAKLAVNLGGDTDTVGAVYGQLAGAYYGEPNIPIDLITKLYNQNAFYIMADEMFKRNQ